MKALLQTIALAALMAAPAAHAASVKPQRLLGTYNIPAAGLYRYVDIAGSTIIYFVADGQGDISQMRAVPFGMLPPDDAAKLKQQYQAAQ